MRRRFVKGTITKTTGGNHNMYSNGNIITNAGGFILEIADGEIVYSEPEDAPPKTFFENMQVEGDFFDMSGNYLGSTANSRKHIYIVGRDAFQNPYSINNFPEGFYIKFVSFNGIGNIINSKIGSKYSKQIIELSKEERINVAQKIFNHYYTDAGYDLNELKYKTITEVPDEIPGGAFALARFGGVTPNSERLKEGEKDISITYPHLGIHIITGWDVINLFAHERGQHMEDLIKYNKKFYITFPGPYEIERRAYMYQLKHKTWIKTSPEFKGHIWSVISSYVHPSEYGPYLKDNYKII